MASKYHSTNVQSLKLSFNKAETKLSLKQIVMIK